jgi:hypothetical protein
LLKEIDFAVEQGGEILFIALVGVNDAVDVVGGLGRTPPARVPDHHPAPLRLELFEHKRAGAIGVTRGKSLFAPVEACWNADVMLLRPSLGHDGDGTEPHPDERVGRGRRYLDGMMTDGLNGGDIG